MRFPQRIRYDLVGSSVYVDRLECEAEAAEVWRVGGGCGGGGGGGVEGNKRKSAVKFSRYWSNLNA